MEGGLTQKKKMISTKNRRVSHLKIKDDITKNTRWPHLKVKDDHTEKLKTSQKKKKINQYDKISSLYLIQFLTTIIWVMTK